MAENNDEKRGARIEELKADSAKRLKLLGNESYQRENQTLIRAVTNAIRDQFRRYEVLDDTGFVAFWLLETGAAIALEGGVSRDRAIELFGDLVDQLAPALELHGKMRLSGVSEKDAQDMARSIAHDNMARQTLRELDKLDALGREPEDA